MKRAVAVMLLLTACAAAQSSGKRIALTPNSKASSGEVLQGLHSKKCVGVTFTGDPTKADYMLELGRIPATGKICMDPQNSNANSACPTDEYSATLFSLKGDVLFQTKTHSYSVVTLLSAMQDVCKALDKL